MWEARRSNLQTTKGVITFIACHLPFGDCFGPAPHYRPAGLAMTGMKTHFRNDGDEDPCLQCRGLGSLTCYPQCEDLPIR